MERVSLLRLLFVATVTFGLLENTVHATSPGQHGNQQGNGPLRYSREFLLNLQNSTVENSPIPDLDLPSKINKNDLLLLFSSACTGMRRGGTHLSVSSKAGGLEKGHPLSSEGVCHGVAPSGSPVRVLGVVCPEGRLVYWHTFDVSEPLDLLLLDVL